MKTIAIASIRHKRDSTSRTGQATAPRPELSVQQHVASGSGPLIAAAAPSKVSRPDTFRIPMPGGFR
jgi:hypothetical protein